MAAKPRLRLLRCDAWSHTRVVAEVKLVHPGWSAPGSGASGLTSGTLRGDVAGQHLTSTIDLLFNLNLAGHSGSWDSVGVTFDVQHGTGSTTSIFEVRLATGGPLVVGLSSILGGVSARFTVTNTATAQVWYGPQITPNGGRTSKIEFLVYAAGGTKGYFLLRVEGVNHVQAYGVNLTNSGGADTVITGLFWYTGFPMTEVGIRVGLGGWTDGDILSDTAGNPRVLPLLANGDGFYQDGTGSSPHYLLVNETIANTTNFVSLPADITSRESYLFQDLAGTITRVLGVGVEMYAKTDTAGQQLPIAFMRANPEVDIGVDEDYREPQNSTYASTTTFTQYFGGWWRKNPATGREFTIADVNSMELGWRRSTATGGLWYVSHVGVEVFCYKSPPAALAAQTSQNALLQHLNHRFARLWQLWPIWGCPIFVTDHNAPLIVDGITYLPGGGFSETDQRRELGLKDANVEISGAITSAAITSSDLRAGRYSGARLVESLVDWRYPWAGAFTRRVWTIEPQEWDAEVWKADAAGMQVKLQSRAGDAYYPVCRFHLFDNDLPMPGSTPTWERGCKLDALGYYRTFDVTGTITDRRVFIITVNGTPSLPVGWFTNGLIVFVTGANKGIVAEIRSHVSGTLSLHLPLPFDVITSDHGMIWPGCNFLKGQPAGNPGDCFDKYNNVSNWGGFDLIPGTDEAMRATSL